MRVLVTGVTGFIGGALRRHFEREGHVVLGTTTRAGAAGGIVHRLGEPVDPRWLEGVEVVVHAAWDLAPTATAKNLAGTEAWSAAAVRAGAHFVFVSSYSAYDDFPTAYGRGKFAAEAVVKASGGTVVRPALVVGAGGLFARMVELAKRQPIAVMPDGGRHDVELVDIDDVCAAVVRCALERRPRAEDLSAGRLSLRDVFVRIARAIGRNEPFVLTVPIGPVSDLLRLFSFSRRATDARERLLGYLENGRRHRPSTLSSVLGRAPSSPEAAISTRSPQVHLT